VILVDSSVWIDFFNGRSNAAVEQLVELLSDGSAPLGMPDLVMFEVLRGFRHEQDFQAARRTLTALPAAATTCCARRTTTARCARAAARYEVPSTCSWRAFASSMSMRCCMLTGTSTRSRCCGD
jgi:predicted nucleic acid-binding protein